MKTGARLLLLALFSYVGGLAAIVAPVFATDSSQVVISQIQTGGAVNGTASHEFIELTNRSPEDLDVTGWCVYYASASSSSLGTRLGCLSSRDIVQRLILPGMGKVVFATGELAATDSAFVLSERMPSGLSATGGHIHLTDGTVIRDAVGWGTAQYAETAPAPAPSNGHTLQRKVLAGDIVDTDNNADDFASALPLVNEAPGLYEATDYCVNNDEFPGLQAAVPDGYERKDDGTCFLLPPPVLCTGVVLSEIMPNPAGTDEGKEYVELYNSGNSAVDLAACHLWVDSSEHILAGLIEPGGYYVYRNLTLPNANGAVIMLNNESNQTVTYPDDLPDDFAYASIDGLWGITNRPTPAAANQKSAEVTATTTSNKATLQPCAAGKVRNPATNRCRTVTSTSRGLTPCAPGTYRNPETNRCRSSDTSSTTLKPCAPNQIRNPETNRCKAIAQTASLLKPCDKGEERNPETNRCRKITGVAGAASAINPAAAEQSSKNYWVFAVAAGAVIAYGTYEYRQEIMQKLKALTRRIARRS